MGSLKVYLFEETPKESRENTNTLFSISFDQPDHICPTKQFKKTKQKKQICIPCASNSNLKFQPWNNTAHSKTRCAIERLNGALKRRFACLNYLRVEPQGVCNIILACVVLHKIATKRNVPLWCTWASWKWRHTSFFSERESDWTCSEGCHCQKLSSNYQWFFFFFLFFACVCKY